MQMQLLYAHLRARVFARSVCTRIANFFKHPMQEVAIVTLQEQENVDRYRVSRECFVAVMVARTLPFLTTLDEVQRDIDAAQASYRARVWEHGGESRKDLRARLSSLQTELQHAKAAIGHWPLARRGDLGSWFGSEFDAMQRVPQVEACRATDTSLLVVTQPLFGYNKSVATWHAIGRVGVSIPLDVYTTKDILGKIRFRNLDYKSKAAAPQIDWNEQGTVGCWGPTEDHLCHAYGQQRMVDVVSILVRFAECAERPELYDGWPVVPKEHVPEWYLSLPEDRW